MKPVQTGLVLGLAYSFPIVVWTLTQAANSYSGLFEAAAPAGRALLILQAITMVLWASWYGKGSPWLSALTGLLLLILIPLPIITVLWLTGALSGAIVAGAEAGLMIFGIMLLLGARWLAQLPDMVSAPAILQVAGITGLWAFRDHWLSWLGF